MTETTVSLNVRTPDEQTSVIDIEGDVTASSEAALMDAYGRASGERTRRLVLNFSGLEYMNSSGIGLLVTLLVRAQQEQLAGRVVLQAMLPGLKGLSARPRRPWRRMKVEWAHISSGSAAASTSTLPIRCSVSDAGTST